MSLELARVCRRSAPPSRLASQQKSFSYREQFRSKKKRTEAADALGQAPGVRRRGRYAGTRDFVLHVCLTLTFTAVMVGSRDQYGHAFSTSIKRQLLDTELPYLEAEIAQLAPSDSQVGKRFEQISTLAEVHRFLQGALHALSTLHPFRHAPPLRHATAPSTLLAPRLAGVLVPQLVDPQATARSLEGWINQQSRLLGAVRLRQVRVSTNSSCVPSALVAHLAHGSASCWAAVTDAAVRTAPIYGVSLDGSGTRRVYRHSSLTNRLVVNDAYHFARLRSYPTSGYQVDIPGSRIYADAVRPRAVALPPPASRLPPAFRACPYSPPLQLGSASPDNDP